MDRHSSLLRPGKRHPASLVNHLFHCEFKIQCFLFVVLSLVVGLCFFGQVVMVEYLPSFICLEGIGFVNHLSLLWFRAIMIPAAPYTDSGLLSIIYPAALCDYRIYCSSSPSYLRFWILPPSVPDEGFGLWRLWSRFWDVVAFKLCWSTICLFCAWNVGRGIYHLSSESILGYPIILFAVEHPSSDIRRSAWFGTSCACSGLWVEAQHVVWELGLAAQLT